MLKYLVHVAYGVPCHLLPPFQCIGRISFGSLINENLGVVKVSKSTPINSIGSSSIFSLHAARPQELAFNPLRMQHESQWAKLLLGSNKCVRGLIWGDYERIAPCAFLFDAKLKFFMRPNYRNGGSI